MLLSFQWSSPTSSMAINVSQVSFQLSLFIIFVFLIVVFTFILFLFFYFITKNYLFLVIILPNGYYVMRLWLHFLFMVFLRLLTFFFDFVIIMLRIVFCLSQFVLNIMGVSSLLAIYLFEFSLGILSLSVYQVKRVSKKPRIEPIVTLILGLVSLSQRVLYLEGLRMLLLL
jgi:hypothetical protein